jgi:hypothetical protein
MVESLPKRDCFRIAIAHSVLILGLCGGTDAEMRLAAAIHRETVVGDLEGAAEQYRGLIAERDQARAVAARALLQLGRCQEKLGRRDEAGRTYARVVKEFAAEKQLAAQARAALAAFEPLPSGPRNLNFERGVPGKVPPGWFVPALPKDADYLAELRRSGCRSGIGCAVVLTPANAPSPFGSLMQSFGAAPYRGKTIRLRAWLRVEGFAPGDRGQIWLSVDRMSRQSGFLEKSDRSVDSEEWTRCEISSDIASDATFINFGFMSFGRGRVWVDDVAFEVVPRGTR